MVWRKAGRTTFRLSIPSRLSVWRRLMRCSRVPGLEDSLFQSDGTMTSAVRCDANNANARRLALGCWLRVWVSCHRMDAGRALCSCRRYRAKGRSHCDGQANAMALGAPKLELVEGTAPEALTGLQAPDAIYWRGQHRHLCSRFDALLWGGWLRMR